ncbi:hypothetical protein BDK51DRAFT_50399 [Blyttiomyces helicus]|uniref:Uncharacterized protein n=1 Tax=Blyttiomyces helicus TaxID=388810 RepID=A0A4P9WG29_9FUNG|nr:hypothetical protein BDK51DRAFT_50399 [Blyttiomyces helicus]|eukprot:RKO89396.1 hypothetical protein BDK51DRAFT_50399 [Blyttiomyces helicus]
MFSQNRLAFASQLHISAPTWPSLRYSLPGRLCYITFAHRRAVGNATEWEAFAKEYRDVNLEEWNTACDNLENVANQLTQQLGRLTPQQVRDFNAAEGELVVLHDPPFPHKEMHKLAVEEMIKSSSPSVSDTSFLGQSPPTCEAPHPFLKRIVNLPLQLRLIPRVSRTLLPKSRAWSATEMQQMQYSTAPLIVRVQSRLRDRLPRDSCLCLYRLSLIRLESFTCLTEMSFDIAHLARVFVLGLLHVLAKPTLLSTCAIPRVSESLRARLTSGAVLSALKQRLLPPHRGPSPLLLMGPVTVVFLALVFAFLSAALFLATTRLPRAAKPEEREAACLSHRPMKTWHVPCATEYAHDQLLVKASRTSSQASVPHPDLDALLDEIEGSLGTDDARGTRQEDKGKLGVREADDRKTRWEWSVFALGGRGGLRDRMQIGSAWG